MQRASIGRMLLTHNDGRLARQVDKPRFVGPHGSVQSGIVSRKRRRNSVHWDGIEEADAAMSWTTRHPEGG